MKKPTNESLILSLIEIIVGILLLINPSGFTKWVLVVFGIVLVVVGLVSIIAYFRADALEAALEKNLAKGLILLSAGLFCALRPNWFQNSFPILIGVLLLLYGIIKLQWMVDMLRMRRSSWLVSCISALLSIVFAIIILANPTPSNFLWRLIAIVLIASAVLDVVYALTGRKSAEDQ